jgi:hypothetical protein
MPRANLDKLCAALEAEVTLMKDKEREYDHFQEAYRNACGVEPREVCNALWKARNEVGRELCEINHRLYAIEVLLFVT